VIYTRAWIRKGGKKKNSKQFARGGKRSPGSSAGVVYHSSRLRACSGDAGVKGERKKKRGETEGLEEKRRKETESAQPRITPAEHLPLPSRRKKKRKKKRQLEREGDMRSPARRLSKRRSLTYTYTALASPTNRDGKKERGKKGVTRIITLLRGEGGRRGAEIVQDAFKHLSGSTSYGSKNKGKKKERE